MTETMGNSATAADAVSDAEIRALLDDLGVSPDSNLIGVLQQVQSRFGYLPKNALDEISRHTKISLSRISGVATFYAQFYTEPRGRHVIRCCRGTACHIEGAGSVLTELEKILGIREGESTGDGIFHLETVGCLGTCFVAPAMMIDDRYYARLTPDGIMDVLQSYGAEACSRD